MKSTAANVLLKGLGGLGENPMITNVVTDSRQAQEGSLFVCIAGERTDGHKYGAQTIAQGAKGIVAMHPVEGVSPEQTCLVNDALDAMIAIGGNYRKQFMPCLVGVTGSVGKTTTKEFCYAVFSAFGETIKTEGNQNNEIGMPNTLLRLDESTRYAVIEMGMQGLGEIEKLALAARPQGAIITCIGMSHLAQLGSRENICKAKMEICAGLPAGAPLVLNGDDELLCNAVPRADLHRVLFAIDNPKADVRATEIQFREGKTHFVIADTLHGKLPVCIPALGLHNVSDALSAYALATRLGLDASRVAAALERYKTTGHRQNIVQHENVTVIEDCYNASPDSMRAALATLGQYPAKGRRIAVLGDMYELGSAQETAHAQLADLCYENGIDVLVSVGEHTAFAHKRAHALNLAAEHFKTKEDASVYLCALCRRGDAILVKASHGMALEQLLEQFYKGYKGV